MNAKTEIKRKPKEVEQPLRKEELDTKILGRTGLRVGIIGLGTAFLGVPGNDAAICLYKEPEKSVVDEELGTQTVIAALKAGVSLIDTAPKYVNGQSESMVAQAFKLHPEFVDRCLVTTKIGYYPEGFDYSYEMTLRCFEASQQRLQRKEIDLVYIHDPMGIEPQRILGKSGTLAALRKLQAKGIIRYVGIAADDPNCNAYYIETGEFDAAMVPTALSLLNHVAFQRIIPAAQRHNVGLVIGTPIERGLLVTGPISSTNYLDRNFSLKAIEQTRQIKNLAQQFSVSLAAVALQWCTRQPQVASSAPGAANPNQAFQNTEAGKEIIPDELWQKLETILKPLDPSRDLGISYYLQQ